jgi:hypothetical protein
VNVALSGTLAPNNQPIVDFLTGNFEDVTVTFGNFADPATIPAGTDVLFVGRILTSGAYDNAANSATFNSLNIPVVSWTSYVVRPDGARWGWHSGGVAGSTVVGNETTITAAGASVFGVAAGVGVADWWTVGTDGTNFNAAGTGTVGTGNILATIGGETNILAAAWEPGQQSAGGVTFTANRLLFNLPDSTGTNGTAVLPDTGAGQQALIAALAAYTPLQVVELPQLIVNQSTGAAVIRNVTSSPVTFDYYEVSSAAGRLNPSYTGLEGAGVGAGLSADFNGSNTVNGADLTIWRNNFPVASGAEKSEGDATGDGTVDGSDFLTWQRQVGAPPQAGWDKAGGNTSNLLVEFFLTGATTLQPGEELPLGNAFVTGGAQDLQFRMGRVGQTSLASSVVQYVTSGPATAVPEPGALGMIVCGALLLAVRRRSASRLRTRGGMDILAPWREGRAAIVAARGTIWR